MLQGLLIKGVQDRVAGAICSGAGSLGYAFAKLGGHATKGALINPPIVRPGEWHSVVLQFHHSSGCFLAHVLNGVLITEPVRTLYCVVHMPAPVILPHIAQGSTDAALSRHRVTAGGEHFANTGGGEAGFRESHRGSKPCSTGADHHHVKGVVNKSVGRGHTGTFVAIRIIANPPATANTRWSIRSSRSTSTRNTGPCT